MRETSDFYTTTSEILENDEAIVFSGKKYDTYVKSHIDRYTYEEGNTKRLISSIQAIGNIKDFKLYLDSLIHNNASYIENRVSDKPIPEKLLDDLAQLGEIKTQLSELKTNVEKQKEIPFEILSGKIYAMRARIKGLDIFDKDNYDISTKYQEMGDDERRYNTKTGRYEIDIKYNGFTHKLDFEYEGGNVVKIHERYNNNVKRIDVSVKEVSTQDILRLTHNRYKIQSYTEAKEISLPFNDKMIKLVILFKNKKTD